MRKRAYGHGTLVREKDETYRTVSIDPRAVASLGTSSVVSSMSLFSHYLRRASRRLCRLAAANDYCSLGVLALITDIVNVRAMRGYSSARCTIFDIHFFPRVPVGQVSSSLSPLSENLTVASWRSESSRWRQSGGAAGNNHQGEPAVVITVKQRLLILRSRRLLTMMIRRRRACVTGVQR